jgi:nucleotide-binding universal stress UspA family protein
VIHCESKGGQAVESIEIAKHITLNNILYLADFSEPSEAALPFAIAMAQKYGSRICAVHVLLPDVYARMAPEYAGVVNEGLEQDAKAKMQRIESRLDGLPHSTIVEHGPEIWPTLARIIKKSDIDLLVLGTRGRTGVQKLLLGSVAEEVLRHSNVPVLTVGPAVSGVQDGGSFRCVLFATDFTPESLAGLAYAVSIARENHSRLLLLHVVRQFKRGEMLGEISAAEVIHQLHQMLPQGAELWCRPELVVKYGKPAEHIIKVAMGSGAGLIVLGVRSGDHLGVATHVARTITHDVVANASCPVLTVRG